MAQIAGNLTDDPYPGQIWIESVDQDNLKVFACDGVALMLAKIPATHSLSVGQVASLLAKDHKKKPPKGSCGQPQLFDLTPWDESEPPIDLDRLKPIMQGVSSRSPVDPARLSSFFKAFSAFCRRVDVKVLPRATFVRCPQPEFQGEVRGLLANLYVRKP